MKKIVQTKPVTFYRIEDANGLGPVMQGIGREIIQKGFKKLYMEDERELLSKNSGYPSYEECLFAQLKISGTEAAYVWRENYFFGFISLKSFIDHPLFNAPGIMKGLFEAGYVIKGITSQFTLSGQEIIVFDKNQGYEEKVFDGELLTFQ